MAREQISPEEAVRRYGKKMPPKGKPTGGGNGKGGQEGLSGPEDDKPKEEIEPVNLWDTSTPPELPAGLLPPVIENYARSQGKLIGADPAGIAMACLAVCASVITDDIKLQPFVNSPGWQESARIWVGLVGDVSAKKTPIINAAIWPLDAIDGEIFKDWAAAKAKYDALSKDEKKETPEPTLVRLIINSLTIEAGEDAMIDNPHGILVHNDELAEWFGSMERYHGTGKGTSDRPFWLQTYQGGRRRVSKVRRGKLMVPNTSAVLLGGIQPDKAREVAAGATDDGLLQRFLNIMLRPASIARDEPQGPEGKHYKRLIERLYALRKVSPDMIVNKKLKFADDAQQVVYRMQQHNFGLSPIKVLHQKAAAAFLKGDAVFVRLCVIFHCIEHVNSGVLPFEVSRGTAERVERFLMEFLQPHQLAFYVDVLGIDNEDDIHLIANIILANKLTTINKRAVQRAGRGRHIGDPRFHFDKLHALGWLLEFEQRRTNDPGHWTVNPIVHERFAAHAEEEVRRRKAARATLKRLRNHEENEAEKR